MPRAGTPAYGVCMAAIRPALPTKDTPVVNTRLVSQLIAAAFVAGSASVALAQPVAPNDTTAQARPADQPKAPGAAERPVPPPPGGAVRPPAPVPPAPTVMPAPGAAGPNPAVTPMTAAQPNDTTAQSHAGEKPHDPSMKPHTRMHPHPKKDPRAPQPAPRVNTGPDSGAPYSPATATDNTTEPKPAAPR